MTHLGALGVAKPERSAVTFDYFGETLAANTTATDLDWIDFLERAEGLTPSDPGSLRIVKDFGRAVVADFDTFWKLARANRQGLEDVFETLTKIVEAVTARPTEQPSGSSDGPPSTDMKSTGGSPSLEFPQLEGRPDLQLVVEKARQAG